MRRLVPPLVVLVVLLLAWDIAAKNAVEAIFPRPHEVARGLFELSARGELPRHLFASLFRVTVGFLLAVLLGVPAGLLLGSSALAHDAFNPFVQALRPISPIAWIPLAILWFGVSEASPIFLIFLASVFPIAMSTAAATKNIDPVYLRAARNLGLHGPDLLLRVILPATLPQVITALRLALGIAWLVVVAAEMIAVESGLGYLIIDARNAGKRYDLVVAGMVSIGLVGMLLDLGVRQLERAPEVRWGLRGR